MAVGLTRRMGFAAVVRPAFRSPFALRCALVVLARQAARGVSRGSVGVGTVLDGHDGITRGGVVDLVDHPVVAAAGGVKPFEMEAELTSRGVRR